MSNHWTPMDIFAEDMRFCPISENFSRAREHFPLFEGALSSIEFAQTHTCAVSASFSIRKFGLDDPANRIEQNCYSHAPLGTEVRGGGGSGPPVLSAERTSLVAASAPMNSSWRSRQCVFGRGNWPPNFSFSRAARRIWSSGTSEPAARCLPESKTLRCIFVSFLHAGSCFCCEEWNGMEAKKECEPIENGMQSD